jgi:O-antigen ligase
VSDSRAAAESIPEPWTSTEVRDRVTPQSTWSAAFVVMVFYAVFEYARLTDGNPWLRAFEPAKVLIGAAALAWLVFEPRTRLDRRASLVAKAVFALIPVAVISGLFASYGRAAYFAIVGIVNFTLVTLLVAKIVNTPRRLKIFVFVLLILMFKLSQHQLRYYQSIVDFGRSDEFLARGVGVGSSSFFGNSNDFGLAVATFFPIPMVLFFGEKTKWLRLFYLICAGVIAAAVFLSGSRGSMLATAIVSIVFLLRTQKKWVGILVIAALLVGGSMLLNEAHIERIESAVHFEQDNNAQIRFTLWGAGLRMFAGNPVLGVGPGNFAPTYGSQYGQKFTGDWVPHSIYVQALAELGIVGFVLLLVILFGTLRVLSNIRKTTAGESPPSYENRLATGLMYALIAFMINGATITVLWYPHLWFIVGTALGLAQLVHNQTQQPPATPADASAESLAHASAPAPL